MRGQGIPPGNVAGGAGTLSVQGQPVFPAAALDGGKAGGIDASVNESFTFIHAT